MRIPVCCHIHVDSFAWYLVMEVDLGGFIWGEHSLILEVCIGRSAISKNKLMSANI